jgi:hypothetical protein
MKVTNSFMLLCEMDLGAGRSGFVKFRKDVGFDLRMAGRASAESPDDKKFERERSAAARTGEMGGHLA